MSKLIGAVMRISLWNCFALGTSHWLTRLLMRLRATRIVPRRTDIWRWDRSIGYWTGSPKRRGLACLSPRYAVFQGRLRDLHVALLLRSSIGKILDIEGSWQVTSCLILLISQPTSLAK